MDNEKTKILIVDDLPDKLLVYRVILEELGQELIMATSGAEALRQVLSHDFAVILLDVNMPEMDGFEAAAMIRGRKRSAHTPIIFITAFADEIRASQGYAHGAVDFILAPVVPEILRAKVKVFVDLFRMTEQVKRQAEERIALVEERSRREAAEAANRHLGFLSHAGAVLGQSLEYEVTCRDVVGLATPGFADRALVAQRNPSHGNWTVVEANSREGEAAIEERQGLDQMPAHWAGAIERSLAEGSTELVPEEHNGASSSAPRAIVLPLRARERTFAVLVLSRDASGRRFESADMTVAKALASRAAVALDNARLYKDIEHADRQKNEFLSMLAHELRNPLAPIRNAVAVLRMRKDAQPDAVWAQDVIDRQVTHLVRLVDDLLDVSRITQGKIRVQMECLDVATIIAGAVETSRPLIEAGKHQLGVHLPDEPLCVRADQARLAQVLANLLNNAAKYTPEGGSIWLSATREENEAVFRVRDTGLGIPPEMLGRVFDLFTQVDRALDRSQGGLGIGLTLVRRLVELHDGTVEAASEGPGRGSEFIVRLPAIASGQTQSTAPERPGQPVQAAEHIRILVVDDNVDAADSLAKLLRLDGHQIRTAYDGLAAIEAARAFKPQAVVLDLGLPGQSGYDVARRLREEFPAERPLLIALSGYGEARDRNRSQEAGFHHHFVKPLDFSVLVAALTAAGPHKNGQPQSSSATV
jgi:signal transduction histidine kinase/DNA-binding response OmpR family regulator